MAQLRGEQLAAHLERPLGPLYVVYGDEPLLVIEAGDAIRAAARRQGYSEREVLVAGQGFNWTQLAMAGGNLSLFGDRKLIDLRIPTGKPGRDGGQALQEHCQRLSSDAMTLITLPELTWQDEKASWFQTLAEAGTVLKLQAPNLGELPQWIAGRLQRQEQSAETEALRFIAERVEGNLLAAHQEIQKLGLLYPQGELSLAQVEQAVLNVARYDVFKLSEAVLSGQLARVVRMLDGLQAEGAAEVLVHWTLAEDIRALKRVRDAMANGQPLPMALRAQRIWGVKERLFERILPRLSDAAAARLLHSAHVVDGIIKGLPAPGWPQDGWQALRRLAMDLVQTAQGQRSAAR